MKAYQGEEIICNCPKRAGGFRRDVRTAPAFQPTTLRLNLWTGASPTAAIGSAQHAKRQWPAVSLTTTGR